MKKENSVLLSGVIAVVGLLTSAVTWYLLPQMEHVWQVSGGIGIVGLIAYFVLDRKYFKTVFARRTTPVWFELGHHDAGRFGDCDLSQSHLRGP